MHQEIEFIKMCPGKCYLPKARQVAFMQCDQINWYMLFRFAGRCQRPVIRHSSCI
jgi:hypothetical protein